MASLAIRNTVEEFGRQAGMAHLALSHQGTLRLKLNGGGVFFLEVLPEVPDETVLLCLARPVGHRVGTLLREALARAHHGQGLPYGMQVGTQGTGADAVLVAGVRQPEPVFTAQSMAHAFEFLGRWMDDLEKGGSA